MDQPILFDSWGSLLRVLLVGIAAYIALVVICVVLEADGSLSVVARSKQH